MDSATSRTHGRPPLRVEECNLVHDQDVAKWRWLQPPCRTALPSPCTREYHRHRDERASPPRGGKGHPTIILRDVADPTLTRVTIVILVRIILCMTRVRVITLVTRWADIIPRGMTIYIITRVTVVTMVTIAPSMLLLGKNPKRHYIAPRWLN